MNTLPSDQQIFEKIKEMCHGDDDWLFSSISGNTIDGVKLCILVFVSAEDNSYDSCDLNYYDYYYIDGQWVEWMDNYKVIRSFVEKVNQIPEKG